MVMVMKITVMVVMIVREMMMMMIMMIPTHKNHNFRLCETGRHLSDFTNPRNKLNLKETWTAIV